MGRPPVLPLPLPRDCALCGLTFTPKMRKHGGQRYCSVQCGGRASCKIGLAACATPEARRKMAASKRRTGTGYVKLNGRHEHRVVMEEHIGRRLRPGEVVHHRDGNKSNNSIDNLELMTQSEHCKAHDFGHHPGARRRSR